MSDRKRTQTNENSLANLEPKLPPECDTVVVRVTGIRNDVHWFRRMDSKERGQIVTQARKRHED